MFYFFHIDVDRSLFVDKSFYFTTIIEADTLLCAKELRFYIETLGKVLKECKWTSDTVLYLEVNGKIKGDYLFLCFTIDIINVCYRML